MILREILDEFQNRVEDPNYWDDTRGKSLANEAIRVIAGILSLTFKGYYEFYTEDGRKQYHVPVNYIANHLLWYNDTSENRDITFLKSPKDIYGKVSDIDTTKGYPTHAWLWNVESRLSLFFYPIPDDVYTMQWWYFREAPKLVNNNDEPILDRVFHQYLIEYMRLASRRDDKEISEAEFVGLWGNQVRLMRAANVKIDNISMESRLPTGKDMFPDIDISRVTIVNQNTDGVIW